jgi:hypothetical protein
MPTMRPESVERGGAMANGVYVLAMRTMLRLTFSLRRTANLGTQTHLRHKHLRPR